MTKKTLGQIAEQAWIDLGEQGESDPDKLWQAAAEAVAHKAIQDRPLTPGLAASNIDAALDYFARQGLYWCFECRSYNDHPCQCWNDE